jgi:hypothetical protein
LFLELTPGGGTVNNPPGGAAGISAQVYVGIGLVAIVAIAAIAIVLRARRRRSDEQGKIDVPPKR